MTHETSISLSVGAVPLTYTTYQTKPRPRRNKQTTQACRVKTPPRCMTDTFTRRLFPLHRLCHVAHILRDTDTAHS